ncbi:serine hydrolase domain-containing protein [Vibrio atypicus]|uniref:serine hydrolase domain-containing protein n=1 Tax=Vibrio atypicus TaxID=558271 RepID=UPI00135C66BB|nr:serine hydrolase domain-containing protein [Vibrio atypicus]
MRWIALFFIVLSPFAFAQQPEALSKLLSSYKYASEEEQHYIINERMKFWQIPSVSISTFKLGKPDWQFELGERNESGSKTTSDTRYQVASISKPVTTLIVLRAVEKGLVKLDADVQSLLAPEFSTLVRSPVTLKQLLSHTAGFNHVGYIGVESDLPLPTLSSYTRKDSKYGVLKQEFPVGEFHYSNGGYIVVQHILEHVYGMPFEQIAQQEVFKPLNMLHSSFVQPDAKSVGNEYSHAHRMGKWEPKSWHKYAAQSAAGLWTTPSDLTKLLLAVHAAYIGKDESWLTQNSVYTINYPVTLYSGVGFFRSSGLQTGYVFHGGVNYGFESHFVLYPTLGTGAVVVTNGQKGDQLALEILRAISVEEEWPGYLLNQTEVLKSDLKELKPLVGRYQYDKHFYADIFLRDGMLYVQGYQQDAYVLHKVADNTYQPLEFKSTFKFELSSKGKVKGLTQDAPFYNGFAKKVK